MTIAELREALGAVAVAAEVLGLERGGRRVGITAFELGAHFVSIEMLVGDAWETDVAALVGARPFPLGGVEQRGEHVFLRQALALEGLTPALVEATIAWLERVIAATPTRQAALDLFAHYAA